MTSDLLFALIGFAFATSVTPGPSNLLLLASGANFGFRRSLPLALGINLGFLCMILVVGLGLGQVLRDYPGIYSVLKVAAAGYVLWLAWKVAGSAAPDGEPATTAGRPISFLQAAFLQWVNPKAWAVALIVTVSYTAAEASGGNAVSALLLLIAVFGAVNLPSISLWAISGMALRRLLGDPVKLRVFNFAMALLLVASMVPVLLAAKSWPAGF